MLHSDVDDKHKSGRLKMCHSLFNHLYESRLLFLQSLSQEFSIAGRKFVDLDPATSNNLFYQCLSERQSFQAFSRRYVESMLVVQKAGNGLRH